MSLSSNGGKIISISGHLLLRCYMSRISRTGCLQRSEKRVRKDQLSTSWETLLGSLVIMDNRLWIYSIRLISILVLSLSLPIWTRGKTSRWLREPIILLSRLSIRKRATSIMKPMAILPISRKNHRESKEVYMITHIIIKRNKQTWKKKKKS